MRGLLLLVFFLTLFWFVRRIWKALISGLSSDRTRPEVHHRRSEGDEIDGGRIIDVPFTEHSGERDNAEGSEGKKDGP